MFEMGHETPEEFVHDVDEERNMLVGERAFVFFVLQGKDLVVAEEEGFERFGEFCCLGGFEVHSLILDDIFECSDERCTLQFDGLDLEGSDTVNGGLGIVFNFKDVDGELAVGFDDFGVQLSGWFVDPVSAAVAEGLAFVEDFDGGTGSETGISSSFCC